MFEWLRRAFGETSSHAGSIYETVDSLNAELGGGDPEIIARKHLGMLKIRSNTIVFGDSMYCQWIEISPIVASELSVNASLRTYPSGMVEVTGLEIEADCLMPIDSTRTIGEISVDSAKLIVAGKSDVDAHWAEVGSDRLGVIGVGKDDSALRKLTKRFGLKTIRVNPVRAEVIGSISEPLEADIEAYLKSIPEYAKYPFMHFCVETNNTFDRVNSLSRAWAFMPIGNSESPEMFVCETGRGDGTYDVIGGFAGDTLCRIAVQFIVDDTTR